MSPSVSYHHNHKGLLNGPGQNNCFLNSAVQVLWHLDIFRRSFRELCGHACMAEACIFCALKELFGQLQFSHERALPPDALRKALAQSFSDQHRFQLGFMDDAAECFENILLRIHYHIANMEAEDMCNAKHCIPHQKFAMTLVEQSVCSACNATSEPLPFTQMVHYVSASALISQAKHIGVLGQHDLFGQLLKNAGGMGDIRDCPSSCGAKIQIRRTLMNRPEIVSVGIVWDSDRPSLEHIMSLLDTLRTHLRLSDIFHGTFESATYDENVYHELVGVVTYYGKHYSTFFFHTKLRVWVYFDDANVREVGPHWEQVVEKCRRGRYQPLLLLFAVPNGSPIDARNAPKNITAVSKSAVNTFNGAHDISSKISSQRSLSPANSLVLGGRRSLTPNPEKPRNDDDLNQRRAMTPSPEQSPVNPMKKTTLPNNDYQNLLHFQEVVFNGRSSNAENDSNSELHDDMVQRYKTEPPIRKPVSRRDSGNWSGDRNSASSSSSTSLENPYHYIIGKMQMRNYGGIPRSPNSIKSGDMMSNGGNIHSTDLGYDSYSLSSTDSLPLQHSLKHNLQLAQIPEGHQTPAMRNIHFNTDLSPTNRMDDCEKLCAEADQLLDRCEQTDDLVTAISLCNAATNKARAAMDAPYSNPQTASFARMKHNACVMRARSLHKKLEDQSGCKYNEGRHSREGSNCSARNSSSNNGISHSRQSSKDKSTGNSGSHSRQNSQEQLLTNVPIATTIVGNASVQKKLSSDSHFADEKRSATVKSNSIEIYATLPKNKKGFLSKALLQSSASSKSKNVVEDEEYLMYERPGRTLTAASRSKTTSNKKDEKRTRSEDRNTKNVGKENSPSSKNSPSDRKQQPQTSGKSEEKQQEEKQKKQHKIRRKLLMGGLIRRKNRSMPDLREDETTLKDPVKEPVPFKASSKDDTVLNKKDAAVAGNGLNGYLSEGNLQCTGNPNLERSKLMRKSFYGSKIFQFNKVPPPPPLRTTSQLSKTDATANNGWNQEPPLSLPFMPRDYREMKVTDAANDSVTYANGGIMLQQQQQQQAQLQQSSPSMNTVITEAQVHQEDSFQSLPPMINSTGAGAQDFPSLVHHINRAVDDIDFTLPPYPSPAASAAHSRQASEEFPPPPPLIGLMTVAANAELDYYRENHDSGSTSGGDTWLRELQAKQAARRGKMNGIEVSHDDDQAKSSVRDLKCKFENRFNLGSDASIAITKITSPNDDCAIYPAKSSVVACEPQQRKSSLSSCSSQPDLKQAAFDNKEFKRKSVKKKSVTFCEQVVLVATADDREVDNYIPNPIFERVLRSVLHKESKETGLQGGDSKPVQSVVPLKRTESFQLSQNMPLKPFNQSNGKENSASHKSIVKTFPSPLPNRSLTIAAKNTKSIINREAVDTVDCPAATQFDGNGNFTVPTRNGSQQALHYNSQPNNSSQISPPYNNNNNINNNIINNNNNNNNNAIVSNPLPEMSVLESNINEAVNGNYHQVNESNCRYNIQTNDYDSRATLTNSEPKASFTNGSVGFSPSSTLNRRLNNYSNFDAHYNNNNINNNNNNINNNNNNINNNNSSSSSSNCVSSIPDSQNCLQTCQPNYVSSAMTEHQMNYAHQNSYQPMSLQPYHHSSPNSSLPSTHHDLNTRIPTRSSPSSANYQTNGSHLPVATAAIHRTNAIHHSGTTSYNSQCPSGNHQNYNSTVNSYHQNNTAQLLSHNSYSGQNPSQQTTHYQPSPLPSRQFNVQYGKYADSRRAPINNLAASQNSADLQHQRMNNGYKSASNSTPPQNTVQTLDRTAIAYGQCPQPNSTVNNQTDSTEFRSNASPSGSNSSNTLHYPKSNSYAQSYHSESSAPYQSMPNPSSLQTTNYHHSSLHAAKPVKPYQQSQQPLPYPQFHSTTASAQHSPTQNYHFSLQGQNAHHAYNSNQCTDSSAPQFNSLTKHSSSQYYPVYNSGQLHQSTSVAQQHNYSLQQMHQPPSPSYSASGSGVKSTQPLPPPVYQHPPVPPNNSKQNAYQRVPTPNCSQQTMTTPPGENMKYSPYQHPPMPKHADYYSNKSPGERTNSTIACSLCKKKQILPPAVYCADCEYYMSRFKQQKT